MATTTTPALPTDGRSRWLRRLASACALLMIVVVTSSAWLRLAQPRPVCNSWPGCRDAAAAPGAAPGAAPAPWMGRSDVLAGVRAAHRAAASTMLPAAGALALLALARRPRRTGVGARALAMLVVALALAALGVVTPGNRSLWVLLGNQLGGLLLLALAWTAWRGLRGGTAARMRGARAVALLWLVQAGLGALSGTGVDSVPAFAHLALAAPALLAAFALGVFGWYRLHRGDALALALLTLVQMLLGIAAMLDAAPPALVLLHAVTAALGLAWLAALGEGRTDPGLSARSPPIA